MKRHILFPAAAALLLCAMPAQAQLFGPSDEEVAAQKAHEDGQDSRIQQNGQDIAQLRSQFQAQLRDLGDQVRSLTDSLARATGANEDLSHQISLLNAKIVQQQKDYDYRLCMLSAQQLGADAQSLNCAAAGTASAAPVLAPPAPAPGSRLAPLSAQASNADNDAADAPLRGRPPGVLGTLPGSPPAVAGPRLASNAPPMPGDGAPSFDAAMNLLARAQYADAAAAFRSYADSHPDDDQLSPQALYWVGHLAAMQHDYATAARTFAEQIKKYPKSERSPDSMLEVGQALIAQGQTRQGCVFLSNIKKQYPDASASTLTAASNARKTADCR